MALPDKTEVQSLAYGYEGGPFAQVVGPTTITTLGLEYSYEGSPFVAAEGGSAPPPTTSEIYIMVIMT